MIIHGVIAISRGGVISDVSNLFKADLSGTQNLYLTMNLDDIRQSRRAVHALMML